MSRDEDENDFESLVLELLTAQLQAQQRISSYVGFFFWLAFVAIVLVAGGLGATAFANWYG